MPIRFPVRGQNDTWKKARRYCSRRAAIGAVALTFSLSASLIFAADITVRLANGEWPPYQSKTLKHYGVASHIVTEAFGIVGVNVQYVFFDSWKRAYAEALSGNLDGTLLWSPSVDREALFFFSEPVVMGESVFFHRVDSDFTWNSFSDLKRYRIGGTLGYSYQFEDTEGVKIDRVSSDEINFTKLLRGRIDVFPSDKDAGYALLYELFKPEDVAQLTISPHVYNSTTYHLIMTRALPANRERVKQFNEGLRQLKDSGLLDRYLEDSRRGAYRQPQDVTENSEKVVSP
ncbi:ABC-type amino acid transport/signal transduction systems, periplasmic component/domain [Hahella chejuensis KCTC 2396]|uniref:ABC-type amino acid transport/signal transduction systems, periplasmic component/domain n=1 Tax=Hahella chejuensis (strain KCTC 2396) TaxID=349521 RepID=Q2SE88_HAHCH|nr:ABC transporter substrate-binding protein [Hahella chejuensis]ABC31036.1 ABC-type amino acid transport/signal transduction systems, periplasmic component/domain [Hahella chejuensis KCTC 2396]